MTREEMDAVANGTDPFVRFRDIDNQSYQDIQSMGLVPPFHPRCRCTVVLLDKGSRAGDRGPDPGGPEIYPALLDARRIEFTDPKVFNQIKGESYRDLEHYYANFGGAKAARKKMRDALEDSTVYMAVDSNLLRREIILKDGRFKNSMETKKGTFKTIGEARAKKEKEMFGITADYEEYDQWPKYGFVSDAKEMSYEEIVGWGYGDAYVKFKRGDVLNRTTVTMGDSYDGNMFKRNDLGKIEANRITPATKYSEPDEALLWNASRMPPEAQNMEELIKAKTVDDIATVGSMGTYLEAQVYGELTLESVETIFVESKKKAKSIKAALKKAGYKDIEVKPAKYDKRLKGVWNQDYDGPGAKQAASFSSDDIDRLGDPWIDKLSDRWIKAMANVKYRNPARLKAVSEDLLYGVDVYSEGIMSTYEKRLWLKEFYGEMAKKEKGSLPKFWYEDYRSSYSGVTEDVFNTKLLERYK